VSPFFRHKKATHLKAKANPYPSRSQKWSHSLGLTLILMLLVGTISRFYRPIYEDIQQGLFEGIVWIQTAFLRPFQETQVLLKNTYTLMHLKEDHERLAQENERLKWQMKTLEKLHHENEILRKSLKIPLFEKYGYLSAKILSSPYDGFHHFCIIEAGTKNGLKKNQAVVVKEGVLGRLEKVGKHVSRVLLLNDANSRIPVITASSLQKAILAGDGTFFPTLVYVGDIRKVKRGEKVVTSGMGGIFPAGCLVGIVDEITNNKIRVRPYVPFQDIQWVQILKINPEDFMDELNAILRAE
jgi:rod shape-determining protein MreC